MRISAATEKSTPMSSLPSTMSPLSADSMKKKPKSKSTPLLLALKKRQRRSIISTPDAAIARSRKPVSTISEPTIFRP
jgi:hypothetical protein